MSSAKNCANRTIGSAFELWSGRSPNSDYKKKLYALNPSTPPVLVSTQRTHRKESLERGDPKSLERRIRQLLADRISGNQVGIWLLVPEHLRLGSWDLLCHWTGHSTPELQPRVALHMVHEAALCLQSMRADRSLSQKGFELSTGLPFVPTDAAIHYLLEERTVAQAQEFQVALGKLRLASGHFKGQLLALDPHRIPSYSVRQMRRHKFNATDKPRKMMQTFFLLDADTCQPVCFGLSSSAQTVTQFTPEILRMAASILNLDPHKPKPLVLADKEHYAKELVRLLRQGNQFDLMVPLQAKSHIPTSDLSFKEYWPGYAISKSQFQFQGSPESYFLLTQKTGIRSEDIHFKSFLCTQDREELSGLSVQFPKRWHVEEFFKFDQELGWDKARTFNLNIRYGRMSMGLLAQTLTHQLREHLGEPYSQWDAPHFSRQLFQGLEGDVRVQKDTIVVTYYNAPKAEVLKKHYENLPQKLQDEGIKPTIPWLYDFKLDFRFK